MIVVSDSTPLPYLVFIELEHVLPRLFGTSVKSWTRKMALCGGGSEPMSRPDSRFLFQCYSGAIPWQPCA